MLTILPLLDTCHLWTLVSSQLGFAQESVGRHPSEYQNYLKEDQQGLGSVREGSGGCGRVKEGAGGSLNGPGGSKRVLEGP